MGEMGPRNRVGIGLPCRPAKLQRLAESIPPGLLKSLKIPSLDGCNFFVSRHADALKTSRLDLIHNSVTFHPQATCLKGDSLVDERVRVTHGGMLARISVRNSLEIMKEWVRLLKADLRPHSWTYLGQKSSEFSSLLFIVTSSNGFYPPPPIPPLNKSGLKLVCNLNIVYGNLKSENS
jgi:hypothetical protein